MIAARVMETHGGFAHWAKRPIAAAAIIAVVALPFAAHGEPAAPTCDAPFSMIRFTNPLVRVAQRLKSSEPITIVAIGSSSTAGAGASSSAASYPSRLEVELTQHFPGHQITVLNRGVGGEEIGDMIERFDADVIELRRVKVTEFCRSLFATARANHASEFPGGKASRTEQVAVAAFRGALFCLKKAELRPSTTKRTRAFAARKLSSNRSGSRFGQPACVRLQECFSEELCIRRIAPILQQPAGDDLRLGEQGLRFRSE